MSSTPSRELKTFPNPQMERDYTISLDCPEFTCLCPMTGQPDFASFKIEYIPNKLCIELKSLKLYMWSYRNEGAYHEAVTNKVLSDLAYACSPKWMEVEGRFNVRGGITTRVIATHGKKSS